MNPGTVVRSHGVFDGVRGLRLAYRTWEIPNPRAAIVLVHGFSDHSGRYDSVGEELGARGLSTFAFDLRGHGRSAGRRGHVPHFEVYPQELDRFRAMVQKLVEPECPMVLLAHSMGGLIALRYLQETEHPFRAAILISPWLGTRMPIPSWKVGLAGVLSRFVPAFPVPAGIRAEDLCHDGRVVASYRDDPLVHDTMTPRLFMEARRAMALTYENRERLREPLLFLLAGDDRIVDTRQSMRLADAVRGDVRVRIFEGRFHELLFEPDNKEVLDEVCEWVARHAE
jgi:lysophospholipase